MLDRLPTILKFCRDSKSEYPNCDVYLVSAAEDEPNDASRMFEIRWTKERCMCLTQVNTGVTHATVVYEDGWRIYANGWTPSHMDWFSKQEYDLFFPHPEFAYLITSDPGPEEYGR
jgi:hypothetical protein